LLLLIAHYLSVAGALGGHGDWVAYDEDTNTVWLSHSPDNNVVVLDAYTNSVRVIIPNVGNGNGIAFSEFFAFVADNKNGTVNVYNKYTYALLQKLSAPGGADGVYWDANTQEVLVSLDAVSRVLAFQFQTRGQLYFNPTPVANISLNTTVNNTAGPDVGIYVSDFRRFYQPIDNFINVIDPYQRRVVQVWKLPVNGTAKGISYDPIKQVLLVGTNAGLAFLVSARDGSIKSNITLPGAVDQSVISPQARRGYLGDKSGYVDVIDLDQGILLQNFTTAAGAHTLTAFSNRVQTKVFSYFDQLNEVGVYVWTH